MRAARIHRFGPPDVVQIDDISRPTAGRGEVLVRVASAGVGPWDAWIREHKSVVSIELPITLGSDLAGIVEAVGPDVASVSPGEGVYGVTNADFTGACAEFAVADAARIARKPKFLNFTQSASAPVVAVTAWQMLFEHAKAVAGQTVLILGGGGNVGSYAGNYRVALFNGSPQYINENPFDIELDPSKPARPKQYWKAESAHYYNHEDHPLRVGNKLLTGSTHIPTPTKSLWFANANSILGNVKWHYNTVINVLPRIEMIAVNEWWWTASCEWADVVFGVDSWAELKHPDMTASVTNPFLSVFPRTPIPRIFNTMGDVEVLALVGAEMAKLTNDNRFNDYWKFVRENRTDVYLQRVLDHSTNTKGYKFADLEALKLHLVRKPTQHGKQRSNRTTLRSSAQLLHPIARRQIHLQCLYVYTQQAEVLGSRFNIRQIGSNQ